MAKLASVAGTVFDRLNDYMVIIAEIMIAYTVISINFVVISRYFFNMVPAGIMETWGYTLLYIPFMGAAWLLKREGHIPMDVLLRALKPRAQVVLNTITSIIVTICCLVFCWSSAAMTIEAYKAGLADTETMLSLPKWISLSVIPIGMGLLFIQSSRRVYGYVKGMRMEAKDSG